MIEHFYRPKCDGPGCQERLDARTTLGAAMSDIGKVWKVIDKKHYCWTCWEKMLDAQPMPQELPIGPPTVIERPSGMRSTGD